MTTKTARILGLCLVSVACLSIAYHYLSKGKDNAPDVPVLAEERSAGAPIRVSERSSHGERPDLPATANTELQSKIEALQATVGLLQREIATSRASETAMDADSEGQANMPIGAEEMEAQREQAEEADYLRFLEVDNKFASEQVDPDWSEATLTRIEAALYEEPAGALNIDYVECRSSMCKLEVNEMDGTNMEAFRDQFRHRVADIFAAGMARQDASGRTVIFLARDSSSFRVAPLF